MRWLVVSVSCRFKKDHVSTHRVASGTDFPARLLGCTLVGLPESERLCAVQPCLVQVGQELQERKLQDVENWSEALSPAATPSGPLTTASQQLGRFNGGLAVKVVASQIKEIEKSRHSFACED